MQPASAAASSASASNDASSSPAAAAASVLDPLLVSLSLRVSPCFAAFEWAKQRDLPAILMKAIVRPSSALWHTKAWMEGVQRDVRALPSEVQRIVLSQLSFHATLAVRECTLSITPSRFHSRQHWVDSASALLLCRSWVRAIEVGAPSADELAAAEQTNLLLLELAAATLVLHPSLFSLSALAALLEQIAKHRAGHASAPSLPHSPPDWSSVAKQVGPLWTCAPSRALGSVFAADRGSSPVAAPATDFLASYFAFPRPAEGSPESDFVQANKAFPGCIGEAMPLSADLAALASPLSLLLCLPSGSLARVVTLRHEMRAGDFPELSAEQEAEVKALRSAVEKLS